MLKCSNPGVYGQVSELAESRARAASRLDPAECVGLLQQSQPGPRPGRQKWENQDQTKVNICQLFTNCRPDDTTIDSSLTIVIQEKQSRHDWGHVVIRLCSRLGAIANWCTEGNKLSIVSKCSMNYVSHYMDIPCLLSMLFNPIPGSKSVMH